MAKNNIFGITWFSLELTINNVLSADKKQTILQIQTPNTTFYPVPLQRHANFDKTLTRQSLGGQAPSKQRRI